MIPDTLTHCHYYVLCSGPNCIKTLDYDSRKCGCSLDASTAPELCEETMKVLEDGELYNQKTGKEGKAEEWVVEYCKKCVEKLKREGKLEEGTKAYERDEGKYAEEGWKKPGILRRLGRRWGVGHKKDEA